MKVYRFIFSIFFSLLLIGCSNDDSPQDTVQQLANVMAETCPQISGVQGLYWDLANGVARGDIPGGIPTIAEIGGNFIHSGYPALGFQYPAGYTPIELGDPQTIGVNMLRDDGQSIWRYVNTSFQGLVSAEQVLQFEIDTFVNIMGTSGDVQIICESSSSQPQGQATISTASVLIRSGASTAFLTANSYADPGLNFSFLGIQVAGAPTDEIENEILSTYLPISWQLLFTGDTVVDSDGDGHPDITDDFPFNPLLH